MSDQITLTKIQILSHCVGCGQCVVFCPHNALSVCGRAMINNNCQRYGICIPYCPLGAIKRSEQ
ncbi:MAG: 4Fe-4S binding protein [Euryarchaeota archaeon]|nr:4Fe-4S binding protein [Euryarchaeota archaeon]